MYELSARGLGKRFGARKVFSNINFSLSTGDSIALTGRNGSGKTTLLMVLLALQRPTIGEVVYNDKFGRLDDDAVRQRSSLVGPYLNLYDQLTAEENLIFFATAAGMALPGKRINQLLELVGLEGRGTDLVRAYSSGMKQRLKYAVALLKEPAFLFLDEPSSNLDAAGKKMVAGVIEEYRSKSIVVIATNEKEEYGLARTVCALSD